MKANAQEFEKTTDASGNTPPLPGQYHVVIKAANGARCKKNGDQFNADIIEYEVLAGTVPGQEGRAVTQFLWLDDGNETDLHTRFALASGLVKPGQARDVDLDQEAPGLQLIINVVEFNKKDGGKGKGIGNYGFDLWGVNDPEVAGVPKDADALALLPEAGAKPTKAKAEAEATAEPVAAGATATADDEFADI